MTAGLTLAWFDPPICCDCYVDHDLDHHAKPAGVDALGMVLTCPECGAHTATGEHGPGCSRSGIMLGERHHRAVPLEA